MLNVIYAESVIILNVIMLSVMVPLHKCHLPEQRKKKNFGEHGILSTDISSTDMSSSFSYMMCAFIFTYTHLYSVRLVYGIKNLTLFVIVYFSVNKLFSKQETVH